MRKSINTPEYGRVLAKLIDMRRRAGLTQRDLAEKLGREHSFVWRIERGERRLDVVEFHWVCQALGQSAAKIYAQLIEELGASWPDVAPGEAPLPQPKAAEPGPTYRVRRQR